MLHKAPASFGLVTYLLQQNVCRRKIKYSLFVFASAAPVTGKFTLDYVYKRFHKKSYTMFKFSSRTYSTDYDRVNNQKQNVQGSSKSFNGLSFKSEKSFKEILTPNKF